MNPSFSAALFLALSALPVFAAPRSLLDSNETLAGSSGQVMFQIAKSGSIDVTVNPGDEGYPGLRVTPPEKFWDLSGFGHTGASIRNTGEKPLSLNLRVDNAGDWRKSPWNTESIQIPPGETRLLKTIFGYGNGFKKSYPLDASKVSGLLLFTFKVKDGDPVRFRIESITAGGPAGEKPPVDSRSVRIKPEGGVIFRSTAKLDPETQFEGSGSVQFNANEIRFPASSKPQMARIKPPVGRWDLRDACEVHVQLRNTGKQAFTPTVRLTSDRYHGTGSVSTGSPLTPGSAAELVIPFEASEPWRASSQPITTAHTRGEKGFGTEFDSDKADAVEISIAGSGQESVVALESIRALATPTGLPDWLGQRPPVPGDWKLTFRDDFDGESVDLTQWNVHGPNYWGAKKLTHWSCDNVTVRDGLATIRLEKKHGFHNDDPTLHESDYTGGYLDTFDKWRQRYGYFEARMKLPTAPGLWPAFWMMPDRGRDSGPDWKRQQTGSGAMEFDIMEHLTRWGPYRYNIAMHWDGYGNGHKSTGSSQIYVQPDSGGFLTTGLLWTPGQAVFYCNGKETGRLESERVSNVASLMMFTLPIGGWDNSPLDDSQLPGDFVIDYVRVWQRADLASDADGFFRPAAE